MKSLEVRLIVEKLSFAYPEAEPLISDLSFELRAGEILGLAGQNGAGKSTLLDLLAGLKAPTRGKITLEGPSPEPNGDRMAKIPLKKNRQKRVSLLPQNVDFFILGDTPREDLSLALGAKPHLDKREIISLIADHWVLGDWLDSPVETLSLGQKKRLALASSLAVEPEVLLLDEPFSGLDWPGSVSFFEDLETLSEKKLIVVLATHEPGLVINLVDKWLLMKPNQFLLASPQESFKRFSEFGVRPIT
jgi:biotin transport system ATP-binding protein